MSKKFDLTYINEISLGDDNIKRELISMFAQSSKHYFTEIRHACNNGYWETFHKLTHSYISEIGMFKPNTHIKNMMNILFNYKGEKNKLEEILVIVQELESQIEKIIISLTSEFAE